MIKHLSLICLVGCTTLLSHSSLAQQNNSELILAQQEYQRLRGNDFSASKVDSYLIAPEILDPTLFEDPHWWTYVQEKCNYREAGTPREISVFSGDANRVSFKTPSSWKTTDFAQVERYSLSESGQVLTHVYQDSTVFFYDNKDRLRQTTSFYGKDKNLIEFAQLYDYDSSGNLKSSAYFLHNNDGYYLDHYDTFRYLEVDSGFYVRNDHHLVLDPEDIELESSYSYSFFNERGELERQFERNPNGTIDYTSCKYEIIDSESLLSEIVEYNLQEGFLLEMGQIDYDDQGRVVFRKTQSFDAYAPYTQSDSIVYISDDEMQQFRKSPSGIFHHSRTITKYDDFGNQIRREIYDLDSEAPDKIEILSTYNYHLTQNGTWKAMALKYTYWDGKSSQECYLREFLDHPLEQSDTTYQEESDLIELLNQTIPLAKR